jgi:hypothetical protein
MSFAIGLYRTGGRCAQAAVSRHPPIPLDMIVARTHMYTYGEFRMYPSCKDHFLPPHFLPNP